MKLSKFNIIKEIDNNILIYNSFTKASIFLEKDSNIDIFKNIELYDSLSDEEKKILVDNGFIIDDDRDEVNELEFVFEQKYFDNTFLNIILVPTMACNFGCPYCFEKNQEGGKEDIKKYFSVLKKYAEKYFKQYNIVQVSLFGGEPMIYIEEALKFLDWLDKDSKANGYDYFTSVVTNGSLLTEQIFTDLLNRNLYSLQITIDSDKKTHDITRMFKNGRPSFDILIDKINTLVPLSIGYEKFKFVLRINLNNTTVERVRDSLLYIDESVRPHINLLIRAIYNTKAYKECNSNNLFELQQYFDMGQELGFRIVTDKYKYQTCEACGNTKGFYLMPDLSMWKCINDLEVKQACIGKLLDDGEPDLIPENLVNWHLNCNSAFKSKKCLKCDRLPDCLGGCPLYKIKNQGEMSCRSFDMACMPYILYDESE